MLRFAFPALVLLCALIVGAPLHARDYTLGDVQIAHPWARVTAGRTGAVYMMITAKGARGDRLVAAASPIAERAELHTHVMDGNVMRMRQIPSIEVKAGAAVAFKPGELHVMLIGLKQPLADGQAFPLTLSFENAGKIEVEVQVQKDEGAGGHSAPQHGHPRGPGQ